MRTDAKKKKRYYFWQFSTFENCGISATTLGVALSPQDLLSQNSPHRGNCGLLLVIKRSRAGFLLSCFRSAHLSICSTAFHGFDGSQGDLQCCNFIPKHLETITARISFTLRFITGYFNSVQCCSLRHPNYMRTLTLGRPRMVRARSFFIIEGHVGVRDGHQIHVFPRGPECGELTKADPPSLAYSCLCDDRETPRDLPCPLHPLPWWMGPGD